MTEGTALMAGRRGLVMGVANDRSIAWGIATALRRHGAEVALTYQGEAFGKRVRPLAAEAGMALALECDVEDENSLDRVFAALAREWGGLDFLVHSIAYADRDDLKGRYVDVTAGNFARALHVSCYSFTDMARRAAALMGGGGSLLTLTFCGADRVVPSYNVMGVAKAALEASVRYLAADLGPDGIRVNALSASPMRTLAGASISSGRYVYKWCADNAPLRRTATLDEVGKAALYLLSDLSRGVSGEIHHVDCGYHVVGMAAVPEGGLRPPASADAGNSGEKA